MRQHLVEGWTGAVDYQLKKDGVALNLTGMTVALVAQDKNRAAVTFTGTVAVVDAATGKVQFNPAAADFDHQKSPYFVRWKVTDAASKVVYFPNSFDAEEWWIGKPPD